MGQYVPFDDAELKSFNNFFGHFRWGVTPYEVAFPEGLYRTNLKDVWNKTFRESGTDFFSRRTPPEFLHERLERIFSDKSDTLLSQTPQQFYAVVDETIGEVGLSVDEVARKINTYLHERDKIPLGERERSLVLHHLLEVFMTPIYTALRKKGYNRIDLCS